jgi:hypothetical protein
MMTQATIDDLVRFDGKAELVQGRAPGAPTVYRRGDVAEAEPAVPGWTMPVDDLFQD